jgi:hypothetical protein
VDARFAYFGSKILELLIASLQVNAQTLLFDQMME